MLPTRGYATKGPTSTLEPFSFERRDPGPNDVLIEILYCGICHSDIHQARDEWGGSIYPMVPGHEIVGRVTRVGSQVKRFKTGELAAVGCFVDSCRVCASCKAGLEQYCEVHLVLTYNGTEKDENARRLGAHDFVVSLDPKNLDALANRFDFILDAVSAPHDVNAYLNLLRRDGVMAMVGVPAKPLQVQAFSLLLKRRTLAGSIIGGIRETQEMLDYCAANNITSDVEVIPIQQVEAAWERTIKGDVRYRFVIDMQTL